MTTISSNFLAAIPWEGLFSTQGIMVMLLVGYAGAMWAFLASTPKVYTVMVSRLETAQDFYEGCLNLTPAQVPAHYYYSYEHTLGSSLEPMALGQARGLGAGEGLWYQLQKNTQLHVVAGAGPGEKGAERHLCLDRECLQKLLLRVEIHQVKHRIRQQQPLVFLAKDLQGRTLEFVEVSNSPA